MSSALAVVRSRISSPGPERLLHAGLLVVIGAALALRLYGLDWDRGFDWTPHPDERAILSRVEQLSPPLVGDLSSLLDAERSPWNPRWFPYGSLPLYLLKGVDLASGLLPGDGIGDLRAAGRILSATADVTTVFMVWLLGSRLYGRREALLASALAALAVVHIQLSHFFAVDTFLALFCVAAVYFMLRVAAEGRARDSALAGAFVGAALATKVSVAPIYGALLIAHLMYAFSLSGVRSDERSFGLRWPAAVRGVLVGAAASLAVLFIAQPYMFLDWGRFYTDVVEQSEMVRRIRDYPYTRQYVDTTPYWYQARQLAAWGLGWPLGIFAWAGLLYVSIRGLRPSFALVYLAAGWALPAAVLLVSASLAAILIAGLISLAALLATLPVRSAKSRAAVVLLAWVAPSFLITGAFDVKFLRYMLPFTPFLLLFGSRLFFSAWERARLRAVRSLLAAGLAVVLVGAALYAAAFSSIYREPHPAVRASEWLEENAPRGSVVLKEHWEEALPGMDGFVMRELPMYDDDSFYKTRLIAQELANADYLVFYSNRLYGTIPRLPARYPGSTAYYRELFAGRLGYELADHQAAYPELAGVALLDDTFRRPGLPEPETLRESRTAAVSLGLGFADESFSVYDHPKVMVLRNTGRYDAETIRRRIEAASLAVAQRTPAAQGGGAGLMLSEEQARRQQAGGTWTDIVHPHGWAGRFPVLSWLLVLQAMALAALPLTLMLMRPLSDRGYLFAKVVGLLAVGLVVWLLASVGWMAFSSASIGAGLLVVGAASALAAVRRRRELIDFVRRRWPVLAVGEVIFLVAFLVFVLLRMANPDLWHPWRGGEKPMDLAYLNAVVRSSYMPPYDPWFGGGYLNYYYWGQFLVAIFVKATGTAPTVAYNLAVPTFFALVVGGSFSVVYNLVEGTRRASRPEGTGRWSWPPVLAGIGAALFVAVLGNLDGAIQLGEGAWRVAARDLPFGAFDYWRSSRMMPADPEGITEFPFFTFLFADLHAHLMALPFTLLALGLALAVVLARAGPDASRRAWSWDDALRLAALGIAVGSLRLINAWDFPVYLTIGASAILFAEILVHGGFGLTMLLRAAVKSAFMLAVGYAVFLPFHLSYETFFTSVEPTTNTTALWRFMAIGGPFILIVTTFFLRESRELLTAAPARSAATFRRVARAASTHDEEEAARRGSSPGVWTVVGVMAFLLGAGLLLTVVFSGVVGSTIPFAAALLALVCATGARWLFSWRPDAPHVVFVSVVVAAALALVIGLDLVRVEGDIDRMNSVFKFYLQVWVLLGIASAYLLWRLVHLAKGSGTGWRRGAWAAGLVALLLGASVYPVLGTRARLADRFYGRVLPLTLDGTAYVEGTVYRDHEGDIDLEADFEGIRWLRENVEGSPIVLEGHTPTYRWGSRISVYTGLPSVVGWKWHQEQQRWGYRHEVGLRIEDVNRMYGTTSRQEALSLLRRYGVGYVYVGPLERLYYPARGLDKFERMVGAGLDRVFQDGQVSIYRVTDDGA